METISFNDALEERADDAIKQIKDKGYDKEIASEGYKNIIRYGMRFFEKDCFVKLDVEDSDLKLVR